MLRLQLEKKKAHRPKYLKYIQYNIYLAQLSWLPLKQLFVSFMKYLLWLVKLFVQKNGGVPPRRSWGWASMATPKRFLEAPLIKSQITFKLYANGLYNHFVFFCVFSSNYFSLVLQCRKEKPALFIEHKMMALNY